MNLMVLVTEPFTYRRMLLRAKLSVESSSSGSLWTKLVCKPAPIVTGGKWASWAYRRGTAMQMIDDASRPAALLRRLAPTPESRTDRVDKEPPPQRDERANILIPWMSIAPVRNPPRRSKVCCFSVAQQI